jgi:hypothetical protein
MPRMRLRTSALIALAASMLAGTAHATGGEFLPVGDPLEAELRVLETLAFHPGAGLWSRTQELTPLGTRPLLRRRALAPSATEPDALDPVRRISAVRLRRGLERDVVVGPDRSGWSTPRLYQRRAEDAAFEVSAGLEGRGEVAQDRDPRFASGSGLHVRATAEVEGWTAHSHLLVGRVEGARRFADPIVPNSDLIAHTEDTYVATGGRRWSARFGRTRWAWGPGEEGSLLLSAGGPAITGLSFAADLPAFGLHAIALNATLAGSAGEQLAAHRVEWQPVDALRVGFTETARYQDDAWRPLYAMGVLPYVLAQRLEVQDEPDSTGALRNNVMFGFDVAWRVADGTRIYGEWLIDDLHAKSAEVPNKTGFQVGWDGAGAVGGGRVTWNGEYTRLSRFVYTSFFGRVHAARGEPLGYFTGPDARRIRVRVAWDPNPDWQVFARAARTDHGENDLAEPFLPGSGAGPGSTFDFEGIAETVREADLGLRWWPAGGVDLAASVGWWRADDAGHVPGATRDGLRGALEVRLTR